MADAKSAADAPVTIAVAPLISRLHLGGSRSLTLEVRHQIRAMAMGPSSNCDIAPPACWSAMEQASAGAITPYTECIM